MYDGNDRVIELEDGRFTNPPGYERKYASEYQAKQKGYCHSGKKYFQGITPQFYNVLFVHNNKRMSQ
ncbi:hypothetical protein NCCP2222_11840 [Sporosarcina sp. NCCP-2222]|nr:hypothetical protein NCCP2222_11840 [Sporosarcina sp. NCCP-2222]